MTYVKCSYNKCYAIWELSSDYTMMRCIYTSEDLNAYYTEWREYSIPNDWGSNGGVEVLTYRQAFAEMI